MTGAEDTKPLLSSELKLRIVSGVILAALVLTMTWIGGQTFKLLWIIASLAIFLEYSRIVDNALAFPQKAAALGFLCLSMFAWFAESYSTALLIAAGAFAILMVWEMLTNRTLWAAGGLAYALLPFFAMTDLRGETIEGLVLILILFACVWGADVFAYFFGKGIGGPKLAPRISPKKTWAGFIGSLIGSAVLSGLVVYVAGYMPGVLFFVIIMVLAIASQIGDLVESVIKRRFGVKDSGTIIPGHGGVLDRIDGLVFSGVLLWLILVSIASAVAPEPGLAQYFFEAFLSP